VCPRDGLDVSENRKPVVPVGIKTLEEFYLFLMFNVHGSVHRNNILIYNSNKMHKSQSLFNLTTALRVSGVAITHLQEHKTTVITASGNTLKSVPTLSR